MIGDTKSALDGRPSGVLRRQGLTNRRTNSRRSIAHGTVLSLAVDDQQRLTRPSTGEADLSEEIGSGSTPRNGAGSIATDALRLT